MNHLDALLIQTPNVRGTFFNLPGKEIPLSLCGLAAYLIREGFTCRVLDLAHAGRISPLLEETLRQDRPRLVGITAYTPNVAIASEVAAKVKGTLPEAAVVLGGFHASALPERTLKEFPSLDYVVAGEGEETLTDLLRYTGDGEPARDVPGLYYREGDAVQSGPPRALIPNLDDLPVPDRGLVPATEYVPDLGNYRQLPSTGILFSRGCPFRCTFCSKSVFGHRIRYRSEEHFLAEVRECIDRWAIRDFRLEDEAPTININKIRSLCQAILRENLRLTWNCFSRADSVDAETLRLMKQAGCYHITYGIESGLETTLQRIQKRISLQEAESTMRATKRAGIECKANFILGFPWESAEDMRQVVRYAKRISPDLVTFNLFKPLPGSALYDELEAAGRLRHASWEDYFTTSSKIPFEARYGEREGMRILMWAVFSFYFRPRFIWQRVRLILRHPTREISTLRQGVGILCREAIVIAWRALRGAGSVKRRMRRSG